jgi:hypothetical protein
MIFTDDHRAELEAVLNREGCAPGSSLHSWRCEDKDRYPEPCDCVARVVDELAPIIQGWLEYYGPQVMSEQLR